MGKGLHAVGAFLMLAGLMVVCLFAPACRGRTSAQEVLIPAGKVWVGAGANDKDAMPEERPIHQVDVPAFYMDLNEVTYGEFADFVQQTGTRTSAEKQKAKETWRTYYHEKDEGKTKNNRDYPVILVSKKDAEAYAASKGKRLPTEAEWERAARGDDQRVYPWGDRWNDRFCNNARMDRSDLGKYILPDFPNGGPIPVGINPDDRSPFGVHDMGGNVAEWTSDLLESYDNSEYVVRGPEKRFYVFKGGSWGGDAREARIAFRGRAPSTQADYYQGFRCVRDAK